jgi:alkylated DNA repair dioxygenase AlkB
MCSTVCQDYSRQKFARCTGHFELPNNRKIGSLSKVLGPRSQIFEVTPFFLSYRCLLPYLTSLRHRYCIASKNHTLKKERASSSYLIMSALDFKRLMKLERERMLTLPRAVEPDAEGCVTGAAVDTNRKKDIDIEGRNDISDKSSTSTVLKAEADFVLNVKMNITLDTAESHCGIGIISSSYYYSDTVSEQDETAIINHLNASRYWQALKTRRLQCWGNFPNSELKTSIPAWLDAIIDELVRVRIFSKEMRPDNVLINQYKTNEGILHHTDGPVYYNKVAVLSLGGDCVMSFRKNLDSSMIGTVYDGDECSVLLQRRSLYVFENDLYTKYKHGIQDNVLHQYVGDYGPCMNRASIQLTDTVTIVNEKDNCGSQITHKVSIIKF